MPSIILNNLFQINEFIKLNNSEIKPKYGNDNFLNKSVLFERKIIQIKCKYQIINSLAKRNYFLTLNEGSGWDIYWTDKQYLSLRQIKSMMPYQKINYIPGICILTNKLLLAQRLNIYRKLFPNEFNFYPKTWIINRQNQSKAINSEQNDEVINVEQIERVPGQNDSIEKMEYEIRSNKDMKHSNYPNKNHEEISNEILNDKITVYDNKVKKITALFKESKALKSIKNDIDEIYYNINENDKYEIVKNDKIFSRHRKYNDFKNENLEVEINKMGRRLVQDNKNYKNKITINEMDARDIDLSNERNSIKFEIEDIKINNQTVQNINTCTSNIEISPSGNNISLIKDASGDKTEFYEYVNSTIQDSSKITEQNYDRFRNNKNIIHAMEKVKELTNDTNMDQTKKCCERNQDNITEEYGQLVKKSDEIKEEKPNKSVYIVKPCDSCQGKGITLTMNINESIKNLQSETMICQEYIKHPLLWNQYKFDIRFYILITSVKHLRIYIYKEGIVRFATEKYNQPKEVNLNNKFMHLTNYSINKVSENFDENCNKKCLKDLNEYLKNENVNLKVLYDRIHDIIVKTVLTGYRTILTEYVNNFKKFIYREACFQLLGFDIILDENFHPYLLEINKNSSLKRPTQIDKMVKNQLVTDMFNILNLNEDRLRGDRLRDNLNYSSLRKQIEYELKNRGNFEMIYPSVNNENYYEKFIID